MHLTRKCSKAADGSSTLRGKDGKVTVKLQAAPRSTAAEGQREAVLAGMGLCFGSEATFLGELASGRVLPPLTDWKLPPIDLWSIFPTGRQASAKAWAFVAFVERVLAGLNFVVAGKA